MEYRYGTRTVRESSRAQERSDLPANLAGCSGAVSVGGQCAGRVSNGSENWRHGLDCDPQFDCLDAVGHRAGQEASSRKNIGSIGHRRVAS